jgi:hypothetical protein
MERRGDGAALDPDDLSDGLVVEVGIVAEEEHEPLALGQHSDYRPYLVQIRRLSIRFRRCPVRKSLRTALLVSTDVDERSPQPRIEALDASEVTPRTKSAKERLVHCVSRLIDVAEDRHGEGEKARVAMPIHLLNRSEDIVIRVGSHQLLLRVSVTDTRRT